MAGAILCKFFSGGSEIRNLGRYLRRKTTATFQPHFIITEHSRVPMGEEIVAISQRVTSYMVEQADFRLADVTISVSGEHAMTNIDLSVVSGHRFPISGFPRALMQKPPPRKLRLRDFSCFVLQLLISYFLRTVNTSLLKKKSEPIVPPRPESTASADHSSEEDQNLVSDDELEFRGQSFTYQASSTLRRPDMLSQRAESSIDSED